MFGDGAGGMSGLSSTARRGAMRVDVRLVEEAVKAGARRAKACKLLGIAIRTYQRWIERGELGDLRAGPKTEHADPAC